MDDDVQQHTLHHYAVVENGVITQVNVIDPEAVGWEHPVMGRFDPWGHAEALAAGWIWVNRTDNDDPPLAWIGHRVVPNADGSITFVPPDDIRPEHVKGAP